MNPYRKLNAPELVDLFVHICDGFVIKPRDAHMLRVLMNERGIEPPQIVLGYYLFRDFTTKLDIPTFVATMERWLIRDKREAEAELYRLFAGKMPTGYLTYRDLHDGSSNARLEKEFVEAQNAMEADIATILERSPAPRHYRIGVNRSDNRR